MEPRGARVWVKVQVEEALAPFQVGGEISRLQDAELFGGGKWSPMKQEARLEVGWRPRGGRSEAALGVKDGDPTIEDHAYRYRATLGPQ